ncbi:hypothetical protein LOTGIDRAFT_158281 [Lottia gigantea]|uniref:Uncharacterized protein n=1 Tax=Lottia gigantea TaxID=225164 RepID=V4B187_LOTGI|nr:hypothetical protein LOTGIDRAFT_158281 [Lottia gigantea]ESP00052.1 hypothetical protein LOTGIDRAFT_158281 [Lottia gigantea]
MDSIHEDFCTSPYFELEKEDDLYEEFAVGFPRINSSQQNIYVTTPTQTSRYENVSDSCGYENVTPTTQQMSVCPLCRSALKHPSAPCACTNVYEEPLTESVPHSDDYTMPNDWHSSSANPDCDITSENDEPPSRMGTETLDAVYELATCPFKVPKPIRKPVTRSYSDASSRPLPKLPFSTFTLPRKRCTSSSGDDSSGYYESIESDDVSSNGYSDVAGSSDIQSLHSSSDGFQDMSSQEEFDYEEFSFHGNTTPQSRRYSLGSATPSSASKSLRKRDVTLSHNEHLDKVLSVRRSGSRRGQIFRSIRARSLFKTK